MKKPEGDIRHDCELDPIHGNASNYNNTVPCPACNGRESDCEFCFGELYIQPEWAEYINKKNGKIMMKTIIFDCEIKKAIPPENEELIEGIQYCRGWHDTKNMGISVICAYDYSTEKFRVFCADNMQEFQKLVNESDIIAGFNNIAFDNKLCAANGITIPDEKSFDILVEIWKAAGLNSCYSYSSHSGFGLDAMCQANFRIGKTGYGGTAGVDWQQGKIGTVIDYCLNDIKLTQMLLEKIIKKQKLVNPKGETLKFDLKQTQFAYILEQEELFNSFSKKEI